MKLKPAESGLAKILYLIFGLLFFAAGIIGLLLPVLPGWLFLFPAFICFAKGSEILNNWLRKRKSFSKYFD